MPSNSQWTNVTYGNGYYVAISYSAAGAYSTNGTTWTASTLPSSVSWYGVTYGNGKFVVVATGNTISAYFNTILPVAYGIYNGPTATH